MDRLESKLTLPGELRYRAHWVLGFIALIWAVELGNLLLGYRLNAWGLYPRTLSGLPGIVLSPFLHYGIRHVIANTIPFVILGSLVILRGVQVFLELSGFIVVMAGAAVWLLGRPGYHVGASGLIMGYFGFLVARGWYERSLGSVIIAFLALLFYGGGVLWSLLPLSSGISWEMHLFGLLAGVLAARLQLSEPQAGVTSGQRQL